MSSWTPLIAAHASAASVSLLLGGYQLARRTKGDRVHKALGWVWVAAMTFVALSSFAIREMRHGRLSLLHLLSVVTLVSMMWAIIAIRRGNVARHRAAMRGAWFGVLGAFIGAVSVPSRRIPTFAVNDPLGATLAALIVVAIVVLFVLGAHHLDRRGAVRKPATDRATRLAEQV